MPPAEQQEETSIRDDFEASIAAIENEDEGAITTETQADAEEQPIITGDLNSDDGQETPEAKAEKQVEAEAGKATEQAAKSDESDGTTKSDDISDDKPADSKPPESWSPAAREGWKDLAEPVRAQIAKRETEINKALNEGADSRKAGEKFKALSDQYAQVIAAEGATDALTGTEELFKTVATLRMGSPQQKAAKIAAFIEHYGIDIATLDNILSGTVSGKPAVDPNDPIAAMLEERMKPVDSLLARMDEQQRAGQFQRNQDAINEVVTFKQDGTHEFYDDVKNDVADMVEMAEKRGAIMPLQEAYDKACALNPEVSGVLTKRLNDERLLNNGKTLQEKREASSSIEGKQSGDVSTSTEGLSLRQTLVAAMDAQTG
jgi:hypothetical protein